MNYFVFYELLSFYASKTNTEQNGKVNSIRLIKKFPLSSSYKLFYYFDIDNALYIVSYLKKKACFYMHNKMTKLTNTNKLHKVYT